MIPMTTSAQLEKQLREKMAKMGTDDFIISIAKDLAAVKSMVLSIEKRETTKRNKELNAVKSMGRPL